MAEIETTNGTAMESEVAASATARPAWEQKINIYQFQGVEKFYNILPPLADRYSFSELVDDLMENIEKELNGGLWRSTVEGEDEGGVADIIVSTEARGFFFGPPVAYINHLGFVPARKHGKTPGMTSTVGYGKEYGEDVLEMQVGLIPEGARVIIIDDLVATGGTLVAAAKLVESQKAQVVAIATVIELEELGGRKVVEDAGYKLITLLKY